MARVTIATVYPPDVEPIAEALADAGIEVDAIPVRKFGALAYLGYQFGPLQVDLQVDGEDAAQAMTILERIEHEVADALCSEAAHPEAAPPRDEPAGPDEVSDEGAPPRRNPMWTLALALVCPFPAGLLYARAFRPGYLLLSAYLAGFVAGLMGYLGGLPVMLLARLLDLVLAPVFVIVDNRRRARQQGEPDAAQP